MNFLVTGAAGFIGAKVCYELLIQGHSVIGLDSINDYYDINLKKSRLKLNSKFNQFKFLQLDISCKESMLNLFCENKFDRVIHLAAQAGVRYSLENPNAYADSNLVGFLNILECCRQHNIEHFNLCIF
ncbi:UDP-glucose 4-epimerase [Providencia stuartii]|nr:UDP-glucose 4-epimerase [Providencia stuartii]